MGRLRRRVVGLAAAATIPLGLTSCSEPTREDFVQQANVTCNVMTAEHPNLATPPQTEDPAALLPYAEESTAAWEELFKRLKKLDRPKELRPQLTQIFTRAAKVTHLSEQVVAELKRGRLIADDSPTAMEMGRLVPEIRQRLHDLGATDCPSGNALESGGVTTPTDAPSPTPTVDETKQLQDALQMASPVTTTGLRTVDPVDATYLESPFREPAYGTSSAPLSSLLPPSKCFANAPVNADQWQAPGTPVVYSSGAFVADGAAGAIGTVKLVKLAGGVSSEIANTFSSYTSCKASEGGEEWKYGKVDTELFLHGEGPFELFKYLAGADTKADFADEYMVAGDVSGDYLVLITAMFDDRNTDFNDGAIPAFEAAAGQILSGIDTSLGTSFAA